MFGWYDAVTGEELHRDGGAISSYFRDIKFIAPVVVLCWSDILSIGAPRAPGRSVVSRFMHNGTASWRVPRVTIKVVWAFEDFVGEFGGVYVGSAEHFQGILGLR